MKIAFIFLLVLLFSCHQEEKLSFLDGNWGLIHIESTEKYNLSDNESGKKYQLAFESKYQVIAMSTLTGDESFIVSYRCQSNCDSIILASKKDEFNGKFKLELILDTIKKGTAYDEMWWIGEENVYGMYRYRNVW